MAIEINVSTQADGGLRVIPHIPSIRPCRLEGKNGIGKSVAIRLLALASGEQPYRSDVGAWQSLRRLVGETSIDFTGLRGVAGRARMTFTPQEWPDEPGSRSGEWIGKVELDGVPAPAADLFELLDVVHLVGTERLADTLAKQRERFDAFLHETVVQLEAIDDDRAEIGDVLERLRAADPRAAKTDSAKALELEAEIAGLVAEQTSLVAQSRDLQKATGLAALISSGEAQSRLEEIGRVEALLAERRGELSDIERALAVAVQKLGRGNAAQKKAAQAEKKLGELQIQRDVRSTRLRELAGTLQEFGIESSVLASDSNQQAKLAAAAEEALRNVVALESSYALSALSDDERQFRAELRAVLESAFEDGLDEYVVFSFGAQQVTVADMLEQVDPPAPSGGPRPEDLDVATKASADLKEALTIVASSDALARSIQAEMGVIDQIRDGSDETTELSENVAILRSRRDSVSEQFRALNAELGALSRGGLTPASLEDAERQLEEALAQLQVGSGSIGLASAAVATSLGSVEHSLSDRENELSELRQREARRRIARKEFAPRLASEPELDWVRRLADFQDGGGLSDEVWSDLVDRVSRLDRSLARLVGNVEGLAVAASEPSMAGRYGAVVRREVEALALKALSEPEILAALFDGGSLVALDIETDTITWDTSDGERRTRPVNAFSSGEQAMAFMRARLRQVSGTSAVNRLVFLDEFGAFISADRRRPLADLLAGEDADGLGSEIIVVLPLQVDYASEASQTRGELHRIYTTRAQQVLEQGYFTEEFVG